jgi:proteasome lid subunit RPN8/RPN11
LYKDRHGPNPNIGCSAFIDAGMSVTEPTSLQLPAELYHRLLAHLRSTLPREGCGLIAFDANGAVELFPGTNTEASETRYNMDLAEVVAAFNEIDRHDWRLGAIYHSHPQSPARPSATDLSFAFYPDALMVIVSFAVEPPDLRAFRIDEGITEVPVVVVEN